MKAINIGNTTVEMDKHDLLQIISNIYMVAIVK